MTLHGENAVHFLCTPKNEGKRVHVPPDEKTCEHTDANYAYFDKRSHLNLLL